MSELYRGNFSGVTKSSPLSAHRKGWNTPESGKIQRHKMTMSSGKALRSSVGHRPTCCHLYSNRIVQVRKTTSAQDHSLAYDQQIQDERNTVSCCCATSRQAHQVSEAETPTTSGANGMSQVAMRKPSRIADAQPQDCKPDFSQLWSSEGHARQMPGLRILATSFVGIKDLIPLHGGLPPATAFPLKSIQLTLKDGTKVDISDEEEVMAAQQYNLTLKGYAPLLKWVTEHTKALHKPSPEHEIIIVGGSNQTLEILMRLFMDIGDEILCEEYTYPHVPESLVLPVGYRSVGIKVDSHGLIPEHLAETLGAMKASGRKTPKLLYTIPVGQNPTGATQTLERKRQIYSICRQYNILIMEDDPYYYLQYTPGEPPRGLENLGQSYLSMDTDSRVIRLDSFAKCLAPGVRLSWLTAHSDITTKVLFHSHGVSMGPSSLSQVVVAAILHKMGHEGFEDHIRSIQEQYSRRAGLISAAASKHLKDLADWASVGAGMFMWLKLRGLEDTTELLGELESAKVIVVPGKLARHSGPGSKTPCPYVRLSFVTCEEAELEVAIKRLADLLKKLQTRNLSPRPLAAPPAEQEAAQEETL